MEAEAFVARIRQTIESSPLIGQAADGTAQRCITFRDYMHLALYDSGYGYYRSGERRVGREGDFYTSAFIGDVMGSLLAEWLAQTAKRTFPQAAEIEIVDWGGGTGRLSRQMLDAWAQAEPAPPFRLTVVDDHPAHLEQARQFMATEIASGQARVMNTQEAQAAEWTRSPVMVVANELLDAFAVHRVVRVGGVLYECGVCWQDGWFASCLLEPTDADLAAWLDCQNVKLAEGQTVEIGLDGAAWMPAMASLLGPSMVVLIDYGDETPELTGPHRMDGTLLMYDNHQAHHDPYRRPGKQDMTAHVDFSLVRARAVQSGWEEVWYGTQKQFLVEAGALSKLVDHQVTDPFHPIARRNRAIRQLLLSDGMSELFKVQVWAKQA